MNWKEKLSVHQLFDKLNGEKTAVIVEYLTTPDADRDAFQTKLDGIEKQKPPFQISGFLFTPEEASTELYMNKLKKDLDALNKTG